MSLSAQKCEACHESAIGVTDAELATLIKEIPEWTPTARDGVMMLERVYTFKGYKKARAFADKVADLAEAAVRGGATALEIGIPYSDPLADGPTIQAAGQRALEAGVTPPAALELMAEVDRRVDVPLIPMTYGAIIEAYGRPEF